MTLGSDWITFKSQTVTLDGLALTLSNSLFSSAISVRSVDNSSFVRETDDCKF